jgi:hypothetical protein
MGFHKRWITSEAIQSSYKSGGIGAVWDMYTRGADALILDGDLARACHEAIKALGLEGLKKTLAEGIYKENRIRANEPETETN